MNLNPSTPCDSVFAFVVAVVAVVTAAAAAAAFAAFLSSALSCASASLLRLSPSCLSCFPPPLPILARGPSP